MPFCRLCWFFNLIGNDIADFCKRIGIADNEGHLNYGGLMCFGKEE